MTERILVCRADEVTAGTPRIVNVRNRSIGLFRVGDDIYALLNVCPHKGAPLCEGIQCGTTAPVKSREFIYHRDNAIIRCAWHGWEFDIRTGRSLVDPEIKAKTLPVSIAAGNVYVTA